MKSCKGCIHEHNQVQDCMHCSRAYTDEFEEKTCLTNAERIHAMTDEELAHFLAKVEAKLYRDDLDIIAYRADEVADALEWLERESY